MTQSALSRAVAAHQAGRWTEAEQLYQAALAAKPKDADALALLGVLREGQGRATEAITLIQQALLIDPKAALFHFYLGNALQSAGRTDDAITAYRQALTLQPGMAEAHYNLGNALRLSDQWGEAATAYRLALRFNPHHAKARNNLALVHEHEKDYPAALAELQKLVKKYPQDTEGWLNLCRVAETAGEYQQALQAGAVCTRLQPDNASAWLGLGVALNRLERHEEAVKAYQQALLVRPEWASAWDNLGQTYQFMNRIPEAEQAFRQCIATDGQSLPDGVIPTIDEQLIRHRHWHLALVELLKGDLRMGFARYRARFGEVLGLGRPPHRQPLWRGEDLNGKTILVMFEQGHGDTLMFARYLPLLKQRGATVKFLVREALLDYFQGWSGADWLGSDAALRRGENNLGDFDYYTSVFDLPYLFGTTLDTIPANIPYLPVPEVTPETHLPVTTQRQVGVVWAGSPGHKHDARRSIPLELFAEIFGAGDCQFYSLNRDKRPGDDELLARHSNVTDLTPRFGNFADMARFVAQMDLIISCDTATAHLAGGMGKPVWTLLPFAPDWRWLLNRNDTPWYPTM
ncbi:MAG: tetratricopeptide repeat protein, partial [Proteobacteria bacterium]|nr:tetratricopeptide repeat protein [Pseudomonadota bacterium]